MQFLCGHTWQPAWQPFWRPLLGAFCWGRFVLGCLRTSHQDTSSPGHSCDTAVEGSKVGSKEVICPKGWTRLLKSLLTSNPNSRFRSGQNLSLVTGLVWLKSLSLTFTRYRFTKPRLKPLAFAKKWIFFTLVKLYFFLLKNCDHIGAKVPNGVSLEDHCLAPNLGTKKFTSAFNSFIYIVWWGESVELYNSGIFCLD